MKRKSNKRERRITGLSAALALLLVCLGMTMSMTLPAAAAGGQSSGDETMFYNETLFQIEYYQYNTCAACHPEEDFYRIAGEQLRDLKEEYPYEIYEYNTFHLDDKARLEEKLKALGLDQEGPALPLVLVGDVCLSGLEEIESGIRSAYLALVSEPSGGNAAGKEEAFASRGEAETMPPETENGTKQQDPGSGTMRQDAGNGTKQQDSGWKTDLGKALEEDGEADSVILYFSTYSCDDCSRVKELLGEQEDTVELPDGRLSPVKIHEFNIMEKDYVELAQYLFAAYEVPNEKQQVPILFYRDGYLSGVKEIGEQLPVKLQSGEMTDYLSDRRIAAALEGTEGTGSMNERSLGSYLSLILTGLINGLNPCGASMLLMLLAAAAMAQKSVWKIGCAYLAGKFAAYYAMGFGLYSVFGTVNGELLLRISRGLTWGIAAVFLVLAVMYLLDFVHVKRQEYDKIRMQLPQALRKWNHDRIEQMSKIQGKWMLPAVAVLGVVISAGEFFCTGQVYLAAILYLMKMQEKRTVQTLAAFFLYVSAMCIPSLILILAVEKTRNVIRASNAAVRWLPFIKLATALVFLALAIVLLVI